MPVVVATTPGSITNTVKRIVKITLPGGVVRVVRLAS